MARRIAGVLLWSAGALLVALGLGLGSAYLALLGGAAEGRVKAGPWFSNRLVGSPDAGLYTRANVARIGLLALRRSEAVYYTAFTDGKGVPLTSDCTYVLRGGALPARWWSVTIYGADQFLIRNGGRRHSYTKSDFELAGKKRFAVRLAPAGARPDPAGLINGAAPGQAFSLTLRLYHPEKWVRDDPAAAGLPAIVKVSCK